MRKKMAPPRGFTVIEIMIALFIVTLLSLIPVKLLTPNDHRTMLRQHVREVVSELYRIQNVAATMNRPYRLYINTDTVTPSRYAMQIDFLDLATNTWTKDSEKPSIDLEKDVLHTITDNSAPAVFPLIFSFNSRGIQLDSTDTPTLTPRTVSFSNDKARGDIISVTVTPLGGIRVTDNFND